MMLNLKVSAVVVALAAFVAANPVLLQQPLTSESVNFVDDVQAQEVCPQSEPRNPTKHNAFLEGPYHAEWIRNKTIEALSGAVQIPTESYDVMGVPGEDARYEIFGVLHEFLRQEFPSIHKTLKITTVNTYNLVMHWQGSDASLQPVLLMGHQDVVPVEPATFGDWEHPPYSGYYDGTWLWGRGSCDDKGDVISILTAVEGLLIQGFQPTRTFVLAFGIDEESSGREGAGKIATYLESTYGRDSFAAILDEGSGFDDKFGEDMIFVTPSTSEKGYLDVRVEVNTPGGHSSVPPAHTAIGILSALIVALESNPHPSTLLRSGTPFSTIQCATAYGPNVPSSLRELARRAVSDDDALAKLAEAVVELSPAYKAMISTTQAVDLVSGGVKVNALPESVSAVVNHRIAEHSSLLELQERITAVLAPFAAKYNLTLTAFNTPITSASSSSGSLVLSDAFGNALSPAPPTPLDAEPWKLLMGTIKASLGESRHSGKQVVVSPMLALGNTDTRSYWNLTRHIFRYTHLGSMDHYNGVHTVNEAVRAEALVENVNFLTKFVLNWDEAALP
ncbi:hypothetical protein EUX98_g6722 [Antrodiella citrinella]|uniref:Peptidase M20 dimerisation domain-containing protein n=1 Tax=Antrodiella citrinella TaxID=2447956 RepID=A0A4S4MP30_9APHY|nr:hypothetical protein EUX98_g6722 [Antrodiella citrinella]